MNYWQKAVLAALEAALSDDQPYIESCKQSATDLRSVISEMEAQPKADHTEQVLNMVQPKAEPVQEPAQTPFPECRFRICDLPGQCKGEGHCHHPAVSAYAAAPQAKPLTNERRSDICYEVGLLDFGCNFEADIGKVIDLVEAAHGIASKDSKGGV